MKWQQQRGFLVLEILIAGLILTASIAATMYLFRLGYGYLEKTRQSNVLSSKLFQVKGLLKTLELDRKTGTEEIGEGVTLKWEAKLLNTSIPTFKGVDGPVRSFYEFRLYRVDLTTQYQSLIRNNQVNVFRYKPLFSSKDFL